MIRTILPALAVAISLTGCGFQPVYMRTATWQSGPAQRELAAINVTMIPDRPGQELRQELQKRLAGDGSGGGLYRYDLAATFAIAGQGISVLPDNAVTRIRLIGTSHWTLTSEAPPHGVVTTGDARAMGGYNNLDEQYFAGDLSNEQNQARLAKELADQIVMQLATWFRRQAAQDSG